jgi:DNA-binding CsgD family transcriptional regulator
VSELDSGALPVPEPSARLRGRDRLLHAAERLVAGARDRRGGALAVLGGPGMGKTALLGAIGRRATGCLVLAVSGVEPERTLPASGLDRLLRQVCGHVDAHYGQLARVFAGRGGPPTADVAFCFAVRQLFVALARRRPVVCCVDDAHRLDPVSLAALTFVARRVSTERIAMVFAADHEIDRGTADPLAGIPTAWLDPLDDETSMLVLVDRMATWPAPDLAADLVDLASGNPLALVESAAAALAGGRAATLPARSKLRRDIGGRFGRLSEPARQVVLMAVVDDELTVDTVLAAPGTDALDEAAGSGLVVVCDNTVTVPTRLVRTIVHARAPLTERYTAHRTLARVLDAERDTLRRTFHRAVTDLPARQRLAGELRDGAARARSSGDLTTSSWAFERAASLVTRPDRQASWLLAAARDSWLAGGTRRTRALLRQVAPLATPAGLRGELDLMLGAVALRTDAPAVARQNLRAAAARMLESDRAFALTALVLAGEASCLIGDWAGFADTASHAAALRRPDESPTAEMIFDHFAGMSATYDGRHVAAVEPLHNVVRLAECVHDDVTVLILASQAAYTLGDVTRSHELAVRAVTSAREKSLSTLIPWALVYVSMSALLLDRHSTAIAAATEGLREAQAAGQRNCAVDHLMILAMLAASQGDRDTAAHRVDTAADWVATQGLARPATLGSWALACLDLADDRPADALDRLRMMAAGAGRGHLAIRVMAAPDVVEAAVRCRSPVSAAHALTVFDRWIGASDCAPRLALSHRCHALLADRAAEADEHFREAIRLHRRGETALELAKTELFYATRLRRRRRPTEARELLGDAVKIFHEYHAEPWARRATAELRAAGAPARSGQESGHQDQLTAQQWEISRLVADGATNREIAARLYLSTRTVDHHLRNIFVKLGVRSRVELAARLR